jgi:hypothetical protein
LSREEVSMWLVLLAAGLPIVVGLMALKTRL